MQGSTPVATGKYARAWETVRWRGQENSRSGVMTAHEGHATRIANSFEVDGNRRMFRKAIKNTVMHDTKFINLLLNHRM